MLSVGIQRDDNAICSVMGCKIGKSGFQCVAFPLIPLISENGCMGPGILKNRVIGRSAAVIHDENSDS